MNFKVKSCENCDSIDVTADILTSKITCKTCGHVGNPKILDHDGDEGHEEEDDFKRHY